MIEKTNQQKLPTFLVIGAGKSGTTSIHEYLRQHPRISLPLEKETHFFALDKTLPPSNLFAKGRPASALDDLDAYLASFEAKGPDEIRGEVCPSYIVDFNAPGNIKRYIPDVKIIAVLRNPVERLYSVFNFLDLKVDLDHLRKEVREGYYYHLLKRYYDLFPAENIKIYFFEEFSNNTQAVMADMLAFIGLENDFDLNVSQKYNPSGKPVMPFLAKYIRHHKIYRDTLRAILPVPVFQFFKASYQGRMYKKADPIPPDLRKSILSIYAADMLELEKFLKCDLSRWRKI